MSCYLKHETSTDAIAFFTEGCGGDGKVGLSGEGTRVDERTARSYRGSRCHVPPVMTLGIGAAPCHIRADGIGRDSSFPSIAPHKICGTAESHCGMGAGKGVMTAAVGALLLDGKFQTTVDGQ